jgi:hypothetical protein
MEQIRHLCILKKFKIETFSEVSKNSGLEINAKNLGKFILLSLANKTYDQTII